jgi:site-specific recombinase XerD
MKREKSVVEFEAYLKRRFPGRRTAKDYISDVRKFLTACPKELREVTVCDIDAFVDQQRQDGLKASTTKRRAAALKTYFDFLAEESGDLSWENPVRMKRHGGKQARQLPRDLSDEAVERLWGVIRSKRDRAWFALMLRAGLRVGEVTSLKIEDILTAGSDEQPARLRVCGKGEKERIVLLTGDAYTVLDTWLKERPASNHKHVFVNERDGGPLSTSGIEYCLRDYAKLSGVPATPHRLRHTYARQLTEAGMPITHLGKLMGHAQVTTTQIYTAGADPKLAQVYQQTIERIENAALVIRPAAEMPPTQIPIPPAVPVEEPKTVVADWKTWETQFPAPLRQVTVDFVRRRMSRWKPRRRNERVLKILGEFRRFWTIQMQLRPIQHPSELILQDLHAYQAYRSTVVTAQTADWTISLVISLLQDLADQGQPVNASVFRFSPRSRPESLPRYLQEDQAQRLEQYAAARFADPDPLIRLENACFFILAHAGLRAAECIDLTFQDLDLSGQRLFVRLGKGQRDRCVYLSNTACHALQLYLGSSLLPPTAPLFAYPNGKPITYSWLKRHMISLARTVGIPDFSPHRLRHTLATRLLNAGMDITDIQKILGHEHVNTTMIYARVLDHSVEAHYRIAMHQIELQQMPLSDTPLPASFWPSSDHNVDAYLPSTLDNSV